MTLSFLGTNYDYSEPASGKNLSHLCVNLIQSGVDNVLDWASGPEKLDETEDSDDANEWWLIF